MRAVRRFGIIAFPFVLGCGQTLELFPWGGSAAGRANDDAGASGSQLLDTGPTQGPATSDATTPANRDSAGPGVSEGSPGDASSIDEVAAAAESSAMLPETGAAAGCRSDADCHGENHRCQPGLHICVQCIGEPADCARQGAESKCNLVNYTCGVPCATDRDCTAPDVCDSQGVCTDCLSSSQCPTDQPRCVNEECVCLSNSDCANGRVCGADQTCH
jgi:hypothetical protein